MGASLELIVAVFRTEGMISRILRELRALNKENIVDVLKAIARLIVAAFRGPGRTS